VARSPTRRSAAAATEISAKSRHDGSASARPSELEIDELMFSMKSVETI
jgi:hypothetical protein